MSEDEQVGSRQMGWFWSGEGKEQNQRQRQRLVGSPHVLWSRGGKRREVDGMEEEEEEEQL